jgi:predicted dehydrogenase
MQRLKTAVIGCGSITRHRYAPELAAHPDVELVAFCDPVISRAEAYAGLHHAAAYRDYEDMLREQQVNLVVVCTPNVLHAPVALAAIEAGAHVIVEKPMASTEAEAEAMIEAARNRNVLLMVAQSQRLMPPHRKARELLAAGKLGRVLTFRSSFGHRGPEFWSVDGADSWFFRKKEAIMGASGDLGVHKADLIRWLLQDEVAEVGAFVGTLHKENTDADDNAIILMRMKAGAMGTITASWTFCRGEDNSTILWCENGAMKIGTHPDEQVIVEYNDGSVEKHKAGAIATNNRQTNSGVVDEFVGHIINGTTPSIPGEEGLRSLRVILAALNPSEQDGL